MRYPMITGHAGNDNTNMNSIESLYKCISLGADAVEVDVRRDKKSVLVLSHDEQSQNIYDTCTKLSSFFEIASQNPEIIINCDLKEKNLPLDVINLARQYGLETNRLILTGTIPPSYISLHPEITEMSHIYLNIEFALEEICLEKMSESYTQARKEDYYNKPWKYIREMNIDAEHYLEKAAQICLQYKVKGINMPYSLLTDRNIKLIKEAGVPISAWTVNDEKEMERLFLKGIANITTKNVAKAKAVRMNLFNF